MYEPSLKGVGDGSGAIGNVQVGQDAAQVEFSRGSTDAQSIRDLLGLQALAGEIKDLDLSLTQRLDLSASACQAFQ